MLKWIKSNRALYLALRRFRSTLVIRKMGLKGVDPTVTIEAGCRILRSTTIDAFSYLGPECHIAAKAKIGKYVMFGPRVAIVGDDHRMDQVGVPMIFSGRPEQKMTVIESDVWIGYGAIIMSGVTVGRGSVVAAGSIVTKDVPPYSIVAGVPARPLRSRFNPEEQTAHDKVILGETVTGDFAEKKQ